MKYENHKIVLTDKLSSLYKWVEKQQKSVNKAKLKQLPDNSQQKAMLAGKNKAYIEIMCYLEQKQGQFLKDCDFRKDI